MTVSQPTNRSFDIKKQAVQLANRLSEVELDENRVVPLRHGSKVTDAQHTDSNNRCDFVEWLSQHHSTTTDLRNYGVYAGNGLLLIDIDDYDGTEKPAALDDLPETFTTKSPHGGEHRYYTVPEDVPDAIKDQVGSKNPRESWGEIRSHHQYVVGPGSQLDGCDKNWCDRCSADDSGYYRIAEDRPIAELEIETLLNFLKGATEISDATNVSKADEDIGKVQSSEDATERDYPDNYDPVPERCAPDEWIDERALERDETLRNLWHGNYAAEGYDDRSKAEHALAFKLAFWLGPDKERVSQQMERASTKKWQQRVNDGYRESVLKAVDKQTEFYSGSVSDIASVSDSPDFKEMLEDDPDVGITRQEARDRRQEILQEAFHGDDAVLVEALPTLGKSYGAVKTAAETGLPVTILTQRRDLYDDVRDWCRDFGLSTHQLPAMTKKCPTYTESPDSPEARKLVDLYERGATPREIHETLDLPCQQNGDCPSLKAWDFDADEYDILVGYYTQAKVDPIIEDRVVVIDECPDGVFDVPVDENLPTSVSNFLRHCQEGEYNFSNDLPTSYGELCGKDARSEVGKKLQSIIEEFVSKRDTWDPETESISLELNQYEKNNRCAPEAVYAVLCGGSEYNGYERTVMDDGTVLLHNPHEATVHVRDPPTFENAQSVICLDGTPTRQLWENTLRLSFDEENHRKVLNTHERRAYILDVQNWEFVQTSDEYVYTYTQRQNVNVDKSAALVEAVRGKHHEEPSIISSKECLDLLDDVGVIDQDEQADHFGNIKSSNDFSDHELGIVIGSLHYGREWVKREAAFAAEEISHDGDGIDKTYNSDYGDALLTHMRDHQVLQAAMRFGRDADTKARVYIHTACLSDWVPRKIHEVDIRPFGSTAKGDVLEVLTDTEPPWTAADLHEDDRIGVTKRQVENILQIFCEEGILRRDESVRPYEYYEDGVENMNDYGFVFGL
jgi:hypothetical protein